MEIDFQKIEKKWRDRWESEKTFEVGEDSKREKFYVLEMFPYPSGTGLHMGHALNYTIGDILARFKRMKGFNVLHPMGFDALGLPAENAAIKAGTDPEKYTNDAIGNFVKQQKALGVSYDWSRMVNTASPDYYKWDQWIFLKMLEKGLAYQKESAVNWCPRCNTVLANEQVSEGRCWRHEDTDVEVRKLRQWFFRTTAYADELLEGLDSLEWPERTKTMQRNWIGRSEGTEISFEIERDEPQISQINTDKVILVDAINAFVIKGEGIFEEMHDMLERYPNRKIVLTGANDEEYEKFNLKEVPYEIFTLKHNPDKSDTEYYKRLLEKFDLKSEDVIYFEHNKDAVKSAESVGIKTFYYNKEKKDLASLKKFIDENLSENDAIPSPIESLNGLGHANARESSNVWKVFTTRPDTIFGVTFMVVSAGHDRLDELVSDEQRAEVSEYLKRMNSVSEKDIERREKEGVFSGSYAVNPANGERVPIWIGNFVLADYGSGMVMGVPAHDKRDYDFAKKYGIEVKRVVVPKEARYCVIEKSLPKDKIDDLKKLGRIEIEKVDDDWGEFILVYVDEEKEKILIEFLKSNLLKKSKEAIGWYANSDDMVVFRDKTISFSNTRGLEKFKKYGRSLGIPEEQLDIKINCYIESGKLINSGEFDGLDNIEAKDRITDWLAEKGVANRIVNFKLRDWGVSRQRYWGTPIPIIYCESCGAVPVPENELPVVLPKDIKFGKGNPLESNAEWLKVKCPKCGKMGKRESDTMDTFVNSSWYFLRYADPKNAKKIFDFDKVKYWNPVDVYIGGAEHACMHLLYARFYVKFLRDLGILDFDEPFSKLFHQGMLHAEDGRKMSKSFGNVVEPIETMKKYGVDATRWFLISVASPDKDFDWSEKGISGATRFIRKVVQFYDSFEERKDSAELIGKFNLALKNLVKYYGNFEYRKATIELRELFVLIEKGCSLESGKNFLKMIAPICPHVAEELWEKLGGEGLVSVAAWPEAREGVGDKEKGISGEDFNEKIISRVMEIIREGVEKVFIYVMPFELEKINLEKIGEKIGKVVEVFAVNDSKKHDPKGMAKKAKPGMAAIYLE